jgi:biopolymer transport protein ExbB
MNLLWTGILSEAVGVLGTVTGMYNAASAISRAGDVSPGIVWQGIHIALSTTILGLIIFVFCTIIWLVFRSRFNKTYAVK